MSRLLMIILWPSFLAAIVGEGLLFSLFDPYHLTLGSAEVTLRPMVAYTICFFLLWLLCALSSLLTCYLSVAPQMRTALFENRRR
jgi:hypothetical protein